MKVSRNSGSISNQLSMILMNLERYGLLLESDPKLPNVANLVAGETIRGSWWGHPKGKLIFAVLKRLAANPEILVTKLVLGKVTFLHRRLWQPFLSLAHSKEKWQMEALSSDAKHLLRLVERKRELRTDHVKWSRRRGTIGTAARELERRLLIHGEEVHTSKGLHAKILRSWNEWASSKGIRTRSISTERAKEILEDVSVYFAGERANEVRLPWQRSGSRKISEHKRP